MDRAVKNVLHFVLAKRAKGPIQFLIYGAASCKNFARIIIFTSLETGGNNKIYPLYILSE